MNRQELVDQVVAATGQSNAAVAAVNAIIAVLTGAVASREAVQPIGSGKATGARTARVGRNPATAAEMQNAAAKRVSMAGETFKEAVNAG
ncbi:HU family DNA-binding protein [Paraburkholderia sp. GAS334]|jgi:DNA-binding protein HU-beta|uniref:HU family DNA-binding protein n=1 Tax=Paraburkholderia sp. GAS334 TaxID=3035131 RepID=UPI003D20F322